MPHQGSGYSATSWKGVVVLFAYCGLGFAALSIIPSLALRFLANEPILILGSLLLALCLLMAWVYGLIWLLRKKASRWVG
jgi:hypothetical protein